MTRISIPLNRAVAPVVLALIGLTSANALAAPIQIATIDALQKIGDPAYPTYPLNGSYVLTQDIDASATATWNNGAGFVPIGSSDANPFTGTLDGQGHVISGLTINRPAAQYVGLLGYIGASGQVKNLGLQGGAVSGWSTLGGQIGEVGALAGDNEGAVTACYATGTVSSLGYGFVGGLVGGNGGAMTQCYATGVVSGSLIAGGLVGANAGSAVTQCYATGAVSAGSVGGLVGLNASTVTQCYATGAVSAPAGSTYVGGLVGWNYLGTTTASYWDTQTSGQTTSAGGTGKTTAAMMTQATFAGWDFTSVWGIVAGETYPFFLFSQAALWINFAASATTGPPPLSVQFTYSASVPEDQIVDWWWQFGDGGESHDPNPTHEYTALGSYAVSLTVTTQEGVVDSTKNSFIVVSNALPIRAGALFVLAAAIMLGTVIRVQWPVTSG